LQACPGPQFRDYHLLLAEQAEQIFATKTTLRTRPQDRRHDAALDLARTPLAAYLGQ